MFSYQIRPKGARWKHRATSTPNTSTCTPYPLLLNSGPKAACKHQIPVRPRLTFPPETATPLPWANDTPGSDRDAESTLHKPPCHPLPVRPARTSSPCLSPHHPPCSTSSAPPSRVWSCSCLPTRRLLLDFPCLGGFLFRQSARRPKAVAARAIPRGHAAEKSPRRPRPRSDGAGRGATSLDRFHARNEVAAAPATRREQSATEVPSAHPRSIMAVRTKSLAARLSCCFLRHYFS